MINLDMVGLGACFDWFPASCATPKIKFNKCYKYNRAIEYGFILKYFT